jgi:hypothetical protein
MPDFRLVSEYQPGTAHNACYLCRAAIRQLRDRPERVIDTLVNIFGEGYLAICESCITEAAALLGMSSTTESSKAKTQIEEIRSENLKLKTELAIAQDAITSLKRWNPIEDANTEPKATASAE